MHNSKLPCSVEQQRDDKGSDFEKTQFIFKIQKFLNPVLST